MDETCDMFSQEISITDTDPLVFLHEQQTIPISCKVSNDINV